MVAKIHGIWRIIKSRQAFLIFEDRDGVESWGTGHGNLGSMMAIAVELKRSYNVMLEMCTHVATEEGELHALQEMKQAIEKLEK